MDITGASVAKTAVDLAKTDNILNKATGFMGMLFPYAGIKQKAVDMYIEDIAFNNKMKILGLFQVSHGIGNASLIDPRGIFMRAVYIGASNLILVHNHPSGITAPSKEDISVHKRLKEAGELMGIPIVDHVIIGSDGYLSFKEQEIL